MNPVETLLKRWKEHGHRMTRVREALLELFMAETAPLSVEEVEARLKRRRITANPSTLYRELDFLRSENFLNEVILDGPKRRFEWSHREHHHHLYCQKCQRIEEVEMDNELAELQLSIQKKKGFKISSHTLEFFGLCKDCKTS